MKDNVTDVFIFLQTSRWKLLKLNILTTDKQSP